MSKIPDRGAILWNARWAALDWCLRGRINNGWLLGWVLGGSAPL